MEDILAGIIKFFGDTIESIISGMSNKNALLIAFSILIICLIILYILTKDF